MEPKVKIYKGKIQGTMQINIKKYLMENPTDTLKQIKTELLPVAISTLCDYLNKYGVSRQLPKSRVVLSKSKNNRKKA